MPSIQPKFGARDYFLFERAVENLLLVSKVHLEKASSTTFRSADFAFLQEGKRYLVEVKLRITSADALMRIRDTVSRIPPAYCAGFFLVTPDKPTVEAEARCREALGSPPFEVKWLSFLEFSRLLEVPFPADVTPFSAGFHAYLQAAATTKNFSAYSLRFVGAGPIPHTRQRDPIGQRRASKYQTLVRQFTASDELHTLGALYESMLREMRDAAGDSGEFYTPRAVVRFIVKVTDPRLGERVLDPATGTGGFLVESFEHLKQQCETVQQRKILQESSLYGCEPKPLPYLLGQMNLLLHGLDAPQIDPGNALRFKLTEIGEKDRVDVIVTNPPFGGEEEKGIQGNFPEDKQTSETALLFLQLIMRRLRKTPRAGFPPARAAVIVPNGTLFGDGVCGRIKQELLTEFNLHTIVRLPNGVFAPYTSIPTNILFFDRSGPTKDVWYYEQPLPEGRKNYTKTAPIQFDEFAGCMTWWDKRKKSDRAWKVSAKELLESGCNLDKKNPSAKEDITHLPPEQLAASVLEKEQRIAEIMGNIRKLLAHSGK